MTIAQARSRARTLVRPIACAALAFAGLTCGDRALTGPGLPQRASLAVAPSLAVAADAPTVRLERVRVQAFRLPSRASALDIVRDFPAGDAPLEIVLDLTVVGQSERFELRLDGLAGGDTVYRAVDTVEVVAGETVATPLEPRMRYVGPDTVVKAVFIAPRDTTVIEGEPFVMRATAHREDGTEYAGALLRLVSRDSLLLRMSAAGTGTARAAFGGVWVVATSANGTQDSTRVVALPAVASVSIAPRGGVAIPGDTLAFTAVTRAASGAVLDGRPLVFSTPDGAIASVQQTGPGAARLAALAPGSARLIARSGAVADTVVVSVAPAPVATVVVTPDSTDVVRGETVGLAVTLRDARGNVLTGRPVSWASANTTAASVDAAGLVAGHLADSVVSVVATSEGRSGGARVRVTRRPVASVVATPTSASVTEGSAVPLSARPLDADGLPNDDHPVEWTSLDPTVLRLVALSGSPRSVSAEGLRAGSAIARATAGGVSVDVPVTVVPVDTTAPVDRIVVEPAAPAIIAGQAIALAATAFDAGGAPLSGVAFTWATSNLAVATVSSTGVVTGTGGGIATITASAAGRTGSASVSVRAAIATVDAGADIALASIGATVRLTPIARDALGNPIPGIAFTFASLDPGIGTVDPTGLVTAHSEGVARIVASAEGRSDEVRVTVALAAASVAVSPRTATIDAVGAELPLSAVARDAGGTLVPATISWSSLDPGVATVSATGVVTAVANGTARVVASAGSASDVATITVRQLAVLVDVTPGAPSLDALSATVALSATARDRNGVVIPGAPVMWRSLAPTIVTVDADGVATAVGNGVGDVVAAVEAAADTVPVAVAQRVATLSLTPDTLRLERGASGALTVTMLDRLGHPTTSYVPSFVSLDPAVATVTTAGVVTVVGSGITRVVATADGRSDETVVIKVPADVPVNLAIARIDVTPATATLRVGDSLAFAAERVYADGSRRAIAPRWGTTHLGRASVTPGGLVTARDTGSVQVTATDSAHSGRATVTILPAPMPTALSIAPAALAGSAISPVTATVSLAAYDQGAGIASATVTLTSPSGAQSRACTATATYIGNTRDGGWRCALTLPAGSETGTWRVTSLQFAGTITRTYTEGQLAARGLAAQVMVSP